MNQDRGLKNAPHPNLQPPTPNVVMQKNLRDKNIFRSPTDNMLSPCTRRLMKKSDKSLYWGKKSQDVDGKEN